METIDDVLAHFGIKGMRWGVRRPRGSDGTVGGGHPHATDAEKAKEYHDRAKTGGTHTLSNQELQHLVNRINLEQSYARLTSAQSGKAKIKRGQNAVREILGVAKTAQEVHSLVNSPLMKEVLKKKR